MSDLPDAPWAKGNEELPIGGEGVLIELVQAPPEVVKAFTALAAG